MHIGIDYTSALNQRAGIGRFTRGLVGGLAEVDRTHQYLLVHARTRRASQSCPLPDNFTLRQLPFGEWAMAVAWQRLGLPVPVELLSGRLDIFHAPDYLLPPLWKAQGVITVHDLSFLLYPECAEPNLVRYLSRAVPKSIDRAALVLADSFSTKKDLIRLLGVPERKVEVVHGGVDARFTRVTDQSVLQRVRRRYPVESPYILSLGTVEPRKNLSRLMEAYAALRTSGKISHRLLIAGARGWRNSELARVYERLKLDDCIAFLGFVPDEDLPALYTLADLFVYPSLYEGFGLPPLEAMACATPVVCSNTSSLPEIVGDAAALIDPLDVAGLSSAMESLLGNGAQAGLLAARGRERASSFTWARAARRLVSIYEEVGAN